MVSNSLASLQARANAQTDPDRRAEDLARFGIGLVQVGRIDEAAEILTQLRALLAQRYMPRAVIRVMVLEDLIPYYRNLEKGSDRIRRALALANAANLADLRGEAAVWLAHSAFQSENHQEFQTSLASALECFLEMDLSHRGRFCAMVADILQLVGDNDGATEWYAVARDLARQIHDHGLMVAIEFNRVAMGLYRIRTLRAMRRTEGDLFTRNWAVELESLKNLHYGLDTKALWDLFDLYTAYVHEIDGNYKQAIVALEKIQGNGAADRCGVGAPLLQLEIEWCQTRMGSQPIAADRVQAYGQQCMSLPRSEQSLALILLRDIAISAGHGPAVAFGPVEFESALAYLEEFQLALAEAVRDIKPAIAMVRRSIADARVQAA